MRGTRFDQDDLGAAWIDGAEVARQRVTRELGDGARHFDAGRPAADDHGRHQRVLPGGVGRRLGALEGGQQPRPDFPRVFQRARPGREFRPFRMPEIGIVRAGRDHELVVGKLGAVGEADAPRRRIDAGHGAEHNLDIGEPPENPPDRPRDIGRRERGGRHLVEKRHEQVIVPPVHDRHIHGLAAQRLGAGETAESGAHDHDTGADWGDRCHGGLVRNIRSV